MISRESRQLLLTCAGETEPLTAAYQRSQMHLGHCQPFATCAVGTWMRVGSALALEARLTFEHGSGVARRHSAVWRQYAHVDCFRVAGQTVPWEGRLCSRGRCGDWNLLIGA
jgi:hypothetical protein